MACFVSSVTTYSKCRTLMRVGFRLTHDVTLDNISDDVDGAPFDVYEFNKENDLRHQRQMQQTRDVIYAFMNILIIKNVGINET